MTPSPDQRLKAAISRHKESARSEDPKPYDDSWGWWIERRIARLENGQLWLIRIAAAALVAQVLQIITAALGLGG